MVSHVKERYVFSQGIGNESTSTRFIRTGIIGALSGVSLVSLLPSTGNGLRAAVALIGFVAAAVWGMGRE